MHPLCDLHWQLVPEPEWEAVEPVAATAISPEEQEVSNEAADVDEMDCMPLTESAVEEARHQIRQISRSHCLEWWRFRR